MEILVCLGVFLLSLVFFSYKKPPTSSAFIAEAKVTYEPLPSKELQKTRGRKGGFSLRKTAP